MPTLHQFVPTLEPGATGAHVLQIQRLLRAEGWQSDVFFYEAKPPLTDGGYDYRSYGDAVPAHRDDLLLYHVAIGSVIADWLMERDERLLLYFHNITPPEYYDRWEPFIAYACTWGKSQVRKLVDRTFFAMAASGYSQQDLLDAGYLDTAVVPILLDTTEFDGEADAAILARRRAHREAGGRDWLFVGRLSPNKTQEDVIKAFAVYRRVYDPDARLALVGGVASPPYRDALRRLADALDVGAAVEITGGVPPAALAAYYRTSDVFVYLSEHEGFGVPILESWHHGIPVVGYGQAAIPEVLGDAGLVLADKAPSTVAAAVHRVLSDEALAQQIVDRGRRRMGSFALDAVSRRFLDVIARVRAAV